MSILCSIPFAAALFSACAGPAPLAVGYVEGDFVLLAPRLEMLRQGALDGLSIGFRAVRSRRDPGGVRRLIEIDLWEVSVVTFPMLHDARVGAVKRLPVPISSAASARPNAEVTR